MTKEEFRQLFERALQTAIANAEKSLKMRVPSDLRIELHGAGSSGEILDIETTVHKLYLGENRLFGVVDIAVIEVSAEFTKIFVRASGFQVSSFNETWNSPPGSGPFKQLQAARIKVIHNG